MTTIDLMREKVTLGLLDFEPACESPTHSAGGFGQIPERPASHLIVAPCGFEGLFCDEWIVASELAGFVSCEHCHGGLHRFESLNVIPI